MFHYVKKSLTSSVFLHFCISANPLNWDKPNQYLYPEYLYFSESGRMEIIICILVLYPHLIHWSGLFVESLKLSLYFNLTTWHEGSLSSFSDSNSLSYPFNLKCLFSCYIKWLLSEYSRYRNDQVPFPASWIKNIVGWAAAGF